MKIAVLVSGGVDSAVVVHKLFKEGHDLHLFYIRIGMDNDEGDCSAEEDIEMCELIAKKYNLPLEIVSLHDEYWEYVMEYTLQTVKKGLTPHPDMMCNKIIKFGFFEERWGKDYDKTATGHYASIKEHDGKYFLATAKDPVKDQTDFLAQINYKQLSHILFPLGNMDKSEVRQLAKDAFLPNANRKDSQGICFLGKINYNDFLKNHIGTKEGPIINIETGEKIGVHKGFWFYTIGQRKGLGLSGGPWFVIKKNVRDNVVYVSQGYNTSLQYGRKIELTEPNWITYDPFEVYDGLQKTIDISFKTRHSPEFYKGELLRGDSGALTIISESDIQGIAPGQFAIIYSPDQQLCLGSAMISLPSKPKGLKHQNKF
ncbi:MAG: tRNA 2-thiouridine(34) synthase MnmA [Muribaculaceae bacterium]|nr:tRNA 2-thiouridine(34) synthase MnmA [Muribaculaceae bacterium]